MWAEPVLLAYTALRLLTAALQWHVGSTATSVTALSLPAVLLLLPVTYPTREAEGAKRSDGVASLLHGLLAVPCLLGALSLATSGVTTLVTSALEASAYMLLWVLPWNSVRRLTLYHGPVIRVAVAVAVAMAGARDWPGGAVGAQRWCAVFSATTSSFTPWLLQYLLQHMPYTFTLGEAMIVVHAALAAVLATTQTWFASLSEASQPTDSKESQAAALFSLLFTTSATLGMAAVAAVMQRLRATPPTASKAVRISWCALLGSLLAVAGVAAVISAHWVLCTFLPGRLPVAPASLTQRHSQHTTSAPTQSTQASATSSPLHHDAVTRHEQLLWPTQPLLSPVLWWRLSVLGYWAVVVVGGLVVQARLAQSRPGTAQPAVPLIIVRKGYHLLALLLFVPVLARDPDMLTVSLSIAWALLVVLELCRSLAVPVLGPAVHQFMSGFVDERDAGAAYVTHLALLLGLATPVWLSSTLPHTPGTKHTTAGYSNTHTAHDMTEPFATRAVLASSQAHRLPVLGTRAQWWLAATAGMVSIGVGDAVASVVGRLVGRHRLHRGTKKTWEGTVAGLLSMLLCEALIVSLTCEHGCPQPALLQVVVHTVFTAALEAVTTQLDNLVVPLWHTTWMLMAFSHSH